MMQPIFLDEKLTYLVGVSGGADSMALLSLCLNKQVKMVVAHVNYKLRKQADKEQILVEEFCLKNNVPLKVLEVKERPQGNLENWAREIRYQFYKEVYEQEKCDMLLLGHQLDDHLETYLMMKERKSASWYYGIKQYTTHHGLAIYRPLLNYRKVELRVYCLENNIPFLDDESNFDESYKRNEIRHQLVEKADEAQVKTWLKEIAEENKKLNKMLTYLKENYQEEVLLSSYRNENLKTRLLLLRYLLTKYTTKNLSTDFIKEIDRLLMHKDDNGYVEIEKDLRLYYEYGIFYFYQMNMGFSYCYDCLVYEKQKEFELTTTGKMIESVNLTSSDFPIIIRNAHLDDKIQLKFGHKSLNRHFIDRKITHKQRYNTVVIENSQKTVIFVEGLGCDVNHFSTNANLFVIKL